MVLLLVPRFLLPLLLLLRQVVNAIRARQVWMLASFAAARPEVPQAGGALDAPLLPGEVALVVRTFFEMHRYDGWAVLIITRRCILNESISKIGRRSEIYMKSTYKKGYDCATL